MSRQRLEVADIFRDLGSAYRRTHAGRLSFAQKRVMEAIETCRTAALGGHVSRCEDCAHIDVAYNSCRNRHCPKCQAAAAYDWLEARRAELLPVAYYHVVFTLPAPIADIAYTNKAVIYNALFKAASEALLTIAADPKHLGAKIGVTMVLHTWGSALTHHPHVHCIVPGGGVAPDGARWIPCRPNFFLPVRVLSRLFRRLMLQRLVAAHGDGALHFFGDHVALSDIDSFRAFLKPLHRTDWVVYAKRPFAGPAQVLSYLARYTHRVAIANSRLVAFEAGRVTFKWKDYRREGQDSYGLMTLDGNDFIRRFLLHVLPDGFHRIRHYGLFANAARADNIALARRLLDAAPPPPPPAEPDAAPAPKPCPCCGGRLILIEAFERGHAPPRHAHPAPTRCDTS